MPGWPARRLLGVDPAIRWAIVTVETRGCGFLPSRRPVILSERHVFHRLADGRFDRRAALESAYWGLGQVMGFNAGWAGYRNAETLVRAMTRSEDSPLEAMIGFIANEGLAATLKLKDRAAFAHRYNGTDYQRNRYDERLALAYVRYAAGPLPSLSVRAAPMQLAYLGYSPGGVDGWFGTNSQAAVPCFQQAQGLPASGRLDAATLAALARAAR